MLTQTKQAPVKALKVCVEELTEDEIRTAIAYMMAKTSGQSILIQHSSPRLIEMILWIDSMNQRTMDKLSLFLMQKIAPKRPSSRIREGRYQGKLNR